jgi:hypothetical protein
MLLKAESKTLIGYNDVTYEYGTPVPDQYVYGYFEPSVNTHFTRTSFLPGTSIHIVTSPYELYYNGVWYVGGQNFIASNQYPDGNQWGRSLNLVPAHIDWQSIGNLGFKTVAEFNTLLSEMDNTTKRKLQGTRIYG